MSLPKVLDKVYYLKLIQSRWEKMRFPLNFEHYIFDISIMLDKFYQYSKWINNKIVWYNWSLIIVQRHSII